MSVIELTGYLASALVLATFCMRDMVALRWMAIASNLAFIAYGALAELGPVLVLHLLLLPINVLRLAGGRASTFDTGVASRRDRRRPPPTAGAAQRRRPCNVQPTHRRPALEIGMTSPTPQSHHRRQTRVRKAAVATTVTLGLAGAVLPSAQAQAFDLDRGNAVVDVVIPNVVPVLFANVAPGDASLVLRTTTLLTNAAFDAIAPYNASALGVYSRLPRRPSSDGATDRNRNVAILYASLPVLNSLYPSEQARWRTMLVAAGVDPAVESTDLTTAPGLGRAAGLAVVAARENDGMNQLGNAGGRQFNRVPYADTTGYRPVNTAYELNDPSRWQPAVVSRGNGIFSVQQFVTPQWALTEPYSLRSPERFRVPPPVNSNPNGPGGRQRYKQQVDHVLAASAGLTDERKLAAELFNNKIESLGFVALFLAQSQRWNVEQFVQYDFLVNLAAFDGGIATWQEKARYDAIRPASAARYLYGNGMVTAWGGPGRGTVNLPANQWSSYISVADHPEYPSGSSCFCAAHAQASRLFLGSDALGWTVPYARGSSRVEPGVTPANDTALTFATWTKFETVCADSRVWAGVHFQAAVEASKPMCTRIGERAHRFVSRHIAGQVPAGDSLRDEE
jgi:hypothetical protein